MTLTPEVEKLVNNTIQYAVDHRHEFVTLEHVLLGLVEDKTAKDILNGCGGDLNTLKKQLKDFLEKHCPKIADPGKGALVKEGEIPSPALTIAFHRVIQRAIIQVQSADRSEVTTSSLLISLMREEESPAVSFLSQQGISRYDVINYVSHGISSLDHEPSPVDSEAEEPPAPGKPGAKETAKSKGNPLKSFCTNLNERAAKGLIDPLIGRADVIERTLQILARRTKNNVLLIGEPGVGKTAIADGLALRIVKGDVPPRLKNAVLYSLDLGSLLAGTKFRGDFENRMKSVIKGIEAEPHALLFIDEIHTLVGAGAVSGGSMDASNLLKPALANRTISCIGSTTYKDYRSYFEKDQALVRRFQKIDIKEPSLDEAQKILEGLRSRYEEFHKVKYSPESIRAAVDLSSRYITGRPLPDKAIDVMDEAGARLRLKAVDESELNVTTKDIEDVVSAVAQVPSSSVNSNDKQKLRDLEKNLKSTVFGQDQALEKVVSAVKLSRSGLSNPNKPIGCYLFTGPTGVGKTEVAKQLAHFLGNQLLRFDMSEYMEKHTVSRLVGAPPGYVGFDEGGLLTEAVFKNPYAVLLLDEMEKAHPDIANVLLQVMDSGKLTDTNGKIVDFRNVILIMTSNAGARELAKQGIGIQPEKSNLRSMNALKNLFTPEFLNRLDAVVTFEQLKEPIVLQIIDKFLGELAKQLEEKKISLTISTEAKHWLFEKGYDRVYGARPLARTIDEHVKKPLVDQLLFGELEKGGTAHITVKEGDLAFTYK